jgi:hypothetical protein
MQHQTKNATANKAKTLKELNTLIQLASSSNSYNKPMEIIPFLTRKSRKISSLAARDSSLENKNAKRDDEGTFPYRRFIS